MTPSQSEMARRWELTGKITCLMQQRVAVAADRYRQRIEAAWRDHGSRWLTAPPDPLRGLEDWQRYLVDFYQRTVLFWDTLRRRGNTYLAHEQEGKPPVLHFDYETVVDARQFNPPVNYALLRILAPTGVRVDSRRRPYIVIDPRAGHGPGIGGFKDDSQIGVAMRAGHPVYFVTFFPEPEPNQTLLDVCNAERRFVAEVRRRHPESPKPVIVGNCQGGWAAMMLAASSPEDTGPIVINGAPMSYWGGSWSGGEGDNPMRYAGGNLGGTWLASLLSDLGNGRFDGAYLVQNFENLNPANTFWDKYYHLFANVDSEPARFLDFERWWGGYFLMNQAEIEWIVENLFVGNQLWSGSTQVQAGKLLDLKQIKAPIILFASLGDNITPPQQAFNWVADVYRSTDEIKACGQTIVGLLHERIGHLGIFVSGKVAKKEHTQIVSVLRSIEALPPGLYGMQIKESRDPSGGLEYKVEFVEHQLEDVARRLNRFDRADEQAFQAAKAVSDLNQQAYELFLQPVIRACSTEGAAELARQFHPLRWQRWLVSDANPWLWWLAPAAERAQAERQPVAATEPSRQAEKVFSEFVSAGLDLYRDLRDAASESMFFLTYGNLFLTQSKYRASPDEGAAGRVAEFQESELVRGALAHLERGGYAEALARVAALLGRRGQSIPLARIELKEELLTDYSDLLPDLTRDEMRRIRGLQEILVRNAREQAVATLPALVQGPNDRERLVRFLERLLKDPRLADSEVSPDQRATFERIRRALAASPIPIAVA